MTAEANITYGFEANSDGDNNETLPVAAGNTSWVLLISRALRRAPHVRSPAQFQRENTRTTPGSQMKEVRPRKAQ